MTHDSIYIYQVLEGIKLSAQRNLSQPVQKADRKSNIDKEDPTAQTFNIRSPSRDKGCLIVMKDYDAEIFRKIRYNEGVTKQDYLKSWTFKPTDISLPKTGAGRSGSLFFFLC